MELVAVVTTVGNIEDARRIAKTVIERRLAACAQLNPIESFYHWDGALQHDTEVRVLFKSLRRDAAALEAAILELHPYELPAVCAIEIDAVNAAYSLWVGEQCAAR